MSRPHDSMHAYTERLRGFLSRGLHRDEALEQLRLSGASPVQCVKALTEVQRLDIAEAMRLVERLRAAARADAAAAAASPTDLVTRALAALDDPPADVRIVIDEGSWYSRVTARDAHVLWRFEWERSVWCVMAAAAWAPDEFFDADLLARHFLGRALPTRRRNLVDEMPVAEHDLVADFRAVRAAAIDGFREDTWTSTRARLHRLAQQRSNAAGR